MDYTEVTSESWFSRIGGAIKGILVGVIMVPIAIVVLFMNEGRQVNRSKALEDGQGQLVSVNADQVDEANEGKLVYLTGSLKASGDVIDADYGLTQKATVKLERKVEYYQVKESTSSSTKKKLGGGTETETTYSYNSEWVDSPIDSTKFKREEQRSKNRVLATVSEQSMKPETVSLGAFKLSDSLWKKVSADKAVSFPADWKLPETLKGKAQISGNAIYYGKNPASPEIGDVKVTYLSAQEGEVSMIAQQRGDSFVIYQAETGKVEMLKKGVHSSDSLFKQAEEANKTTSWILRLVGAVVMFIGFSLILRPLSVLADVLPILGDIVGMGTGLVAFIFALIGSSFVIAISWVFHRPLIGCSLLVITVAGIVWFVKSRKKKSA